MSASTWTFVLHNVTAHESEIEEYARSRGIGLCPETGSGEGGSVTLRGFFPPRTLRAFQRKFDACTGYWRPAW